MFGSFTPQAFCGLTDEEPAPGAFEAINEYAASFWCATTRHETLTHA